MAFLTDLRESRPSDDRLIGRIVQLPPPGFWICKLGGDSLWRLGLMHAAIFLVCAALGPSTHAQSMTEYQVKAAFLYNFAKFVEWPSDAPGDDHNSIVLGIVGEDSFRDLLEHTVQGKTVNGRRLVVRRPKNASDARACQIVFIGASEKKRLRPLLDSLKGAGVLTVGESEGFAQLGGIINFTLEDNRVHFEINVDAADRAGLKISSKLLSLAKIVRDGRPGGRS